MFEAIKAALHHGGFVFLPRFHPDKDTANLAHQFGTPLAPWDNRVVQKLTPQTENTPNTYSGLHGLGAFPLHTDLAHWVKPPRFLMLRCLKGFADVPTLIADSHRLAVDVGPRLLSRGIFRPRRPISGALSLLPLLEVDGEIHRMRWDNVFLQPASKVAEIAKLRVNAWLVENDPIAIPLVQPGDTLLMDNWRMLHGRAPVAQGSISRVLERVYLGELN